MEDSCETETEAFVETNGESSDADSAEFCRVMRGLTMFFASVCADENLMVPHAFMKSAAEAACPQAFVSQLAKSKKSAPLPIYRAISRQRSTLVTFHVLLRSSLLAS